MGGGRRGHVLPEDALLVEHARVVGALAHEMPHSLGRLCEGSGLGECVRLVRGLVLVDILEQLGAKQARDRVVLSEDALLQPRECRLGCLECLHERHGLGFELFQPARRLRARSNFGIERIQLRLDERTARLELGQRVDHRLKLNRPHVERHGLREVLLLRSGGKGLELDGRLHIQRYSKEVIGDLGELANGARAFGRVEEAILVLVKHLEQRAHPVGLQPPRGDELLARCILKLCEREACRGHLRRRCHLGCATTHANSSVRPITTVQLNSTQLSCSFVRCETRCFTRGGGGGRRARAPC